MRVLALGLAALALTGCTAPAAQGAAPEHSVAATAAERATRTAPATRAPSTPRSPHATGTRTAAPRDGLTTCALDSLPPQARDTAELVVAGGPFPYRRNDGVTYFNRNRVLPPAARGSYREFTVRTPGASTRGARRLVTAGNPTSGDPTTTPSAWYYTGDHYETFCRVTGTP